MLESDLNRIFAYPSLEYMLNNVADAEFPEQYLPMLFSFLKKMNLDVGKGGCMKPFKVETNIQGYRFAVNQLVILKYGFYFCIS